MNIKNTIHHKRYCIFVVLFSVALAVSLAGCGFISHFLPGALYSPTYVANRDGHYFVGTRSPCSTEIRQVGVFGDWPTSHRTDPGYFDTAMWHAAADPGVRELELFATGQPNVVVLVGEAVVPDMEFVDIDAQGDGGDWGSMQVNLAEIGDGMVSGPGGLLSWTQFMNIPDSDFGCWKD